MTSLVQRSHLCMRTVAALHTVATAAAAAATAAAAAAAAQWSESNHDLSVVPHSVSHRQ